MSDDVWVDFDGDGEASDEQYEAVDMGDEGTAYVSEGGEVAVDEDNDGLIDTLYADTDGDGALDTEMTDVDGDGYMDEETSFEGDPLADEEGKGGESGGSSDDEKPAEGESSGSSGESGGGEGGLDGLFS